VEWGFLGGCLANVSERITFLVESWRWNKGNYQGKTRDQEVISAETLNQSINKTAYGYTEKHLRPKEKIGNKGSTLSKRLRALWK